MRWLVAFLLALWVVLGVGAYLFPAIAGTLIGGGVGATVSVAVFTATRGQAKRNTALDLFKEYYSADFADQRRKAERFMAKHADVDWSANDPYLLDETDTDLSGYSAVLRFWQRVATLHNEGEIPPGLIQRLLSRELGFWNTKLFQPMKARKGMYVRGPIIDLAEKFATGQGRSAFEAGELDGKRAVPPELEGPGRGNALPPEEAEAAVETSG